MRLFGLFMLIFIMWIMIMTVSFFLVFIIGPLHINVFHNTMDRFISSIIKASMAIGLVIVLILLLGFPENEIFTKSVTEERIV
jgi:fatty acid desaturase